MQCCLFSFVSIYTYSMRSNSTKLLFHKFYKHLLLLFMHCIWILWNTRLSWVKCNVLYCGLAHRGNVLQAINASDQTHEPAQTVW